MYRNLLIIFALAAGLAALLIWQPWRGESELPPRIYDRLPEAEIIGVSNVLELSSSLSETMFYYKIPFRDFISPDFILSQGKNYGLDVQSPVFFFMNEEDNLPDDWGVMLSVRDSSKVREGIDHLKKFMEIKTREVHKTPVYSSPEYNAHIVYGDDWIFLYHGNHLATILKSVVFAKHNEISPRWRAFVNENTDAAVGLVASITSDKFDKYGIESAKIALSNDSSSLIFNTSITQFDSLPFQTKEAGFSYDPQEFTKYLVNLHFDIDKLRKRPNAPIYKGLKEVGAKVGFPVEKFLNAWEGDVAFRQGGIETIREKYIESELDENFNITEVTKYRNVKVSGFSLYLSMNEQLPPLVDQLQSKGILTGNGQKYRLLFSPPLRMHTSDSALVFHTSKYRPELLKDSVNNVMWSFNYTPVQFYLDSTSAKTVFGRIQLPLKKIISDNIPELER